MMEPNTIIKIWEYLKYTADQAGITVELDDDIIALRGRIKLKIGNVTKKTFPEIHEAQLFVNGWLEAQRYLNPEPNEEG